MEINSELIISLLYVSTDVFVCVCVCVVGLLILTLPLRGSVLSVYDQKWLKKKNCYIVEHNCGSELCHAR